MAPIDRLEAGLAKSQGNGCDVDGTVKKFQHSFEKQADKADQLLKAKQERELRKLLTRLSSHKV